MTGDTRSTPSADVAATRGAPPAIDVRGLRFRHPDGTVALAGVDLVVQPGERVAVLGPNGAGKSTLALHFNGLLRPEAGTVHVHGIDVAVDPRAVRRRLGLVFQDANDQLFMPTVRDDVAFGPRNLGLDDDEVAARVEESLAAMGLRTLADRPPHHLSAGERRRAAVATVLAMEPDVIVLDEPSAGIDPHSVNGLAAVLGGLDVTLVVITHDLPFALQTCDVAVVMDSGRVVARRPIEQLLGDRSMLRDHRLALPFRWSGDG